MLSANILDLFDQTIFYGRLTVENGRIARIDREGPERPNESYILPGFVDAHVHIESSLLTPAQFARMAVVHGTVATVSDPHEIGNVLGIKGVEYMIEDGKRVPFKFWFGAPSCVPATQYEAAGASIGVRGVRQLLAMREIGYLAEMMNFPAVLHLDPDVMAKITLANAFNKPIDGHAPGLRGEEVQRYINAGIDTDHECFTYEEGLDKVQRGMHILIREGSAARNFEALIPLIAEHPDRIMFCSDDKHPDTLQSGHINQLVTRAIGSGYNLWHVLRAACLNPVLHYRLPVGLLREGDPADFIQVDNLQSFQISQTVIDGQVVAEGGVSNIPDLRSERVNQFNCEAKQAEAFRVAVPSGVEAPFNIRVIEALDGQLITNEVLVEPLIQHGWLVADPQRNILKIAVVNRYQNTPPAVAFIKNFGLKHGAFASSVGHDSHNIIAVGCDDESLCQAINLVIDAKGGLSAVSGQPEQTGDFSTHLLPLPIAGLMTDADGYQVAQQYTAIDTFVKQELSSTLTAPFMTLSFMALLVIPQLKLSDKGLFDGHSFSFVPLFS